MSSCRRPSSGKLHKVSVRELARGPVGVVRVLMPGHAAHRSIVPQTTGGGDSLGARSVPREISNEFAWTASATIAESARRDDGRTAQFLRAGIRSRPHERAGRKRPRFVRGIGSTRPPSSAISPDHLPGFRGPLEIRQFEGGQSNPTYFLRTAGPRLRAAQEAARPVAAVGARGRSRIPRDDGARRHAMCRCRRRC